MAEDHVLCQYQQAEDKGVYLLQQLREFAPNTDIAAEIEGQIEDELRHARLFKERLNDLDIDCEGLKKSLSKIYDLAQSYVDEKDWARSITVQTIIEELAMSTFTEHLEEQDEQTQTILNEIIEDEAAHLAFGMRELGKIAKKDAEKIREVHLAIAEIFKEAFKDETYSKDELKILVRTVTKAYKMHLARLNKLSLTLPRIGIFG